MKDQRSSAISVRISKMRHSSTWASRNVSPTVKFGRHPSAGGVEDLLADVDY
jgi:hypothetical protein